MPKVVVLGLGLSGLAAYDSLHAKSLTSVVSINNSFELGGYTRTISIDRFRFDYTGHFLHLNHFQSPSDIGSLGYLYKEDWSKFRKQSSVYIRGNYCPAPVQYNYHLLGSDYYTSVQNSLSDINPQFEDYDSLQLDTFFRNTYGQVLADSFFIPYNTKLLDIDLSHISTSHIGRFFPRIDLKLLKNPASPARVSSYNDYFWYPQNGGISHFLDHFVSPKTPIIASAHQINLSEHILTLNTGETIEYDALLSSIPLDVLLRCSGLHQNTDVHFSSSSQYVLHVALKTSNPQLCSNTWIYIPDINTNVYRIGNYTSVNPLMSSNSDIQSIYIEIRGSSQDPRKDALNYLHEHYGVSETDILASTLNKLDPGYVHFTRSSHRTQTLSLLDTLQSYDIYSFGRYGSWDYISMEDSILQAYSAVDSLNL